MLNEHQLACVDVLREAVKEAEDGRIHALALVVCMDGGWASVLAGNRPGDLNLGLDDCKGKILDAVVNDAGLNKRRSNILRVK